MKSFKSLTEREVLALAIMLEEEDGRIYGDFAEALDEHYPKSAQIFRSMQKVEANHRRRLMDLYVERFGEHLPLIRREDVRGFVKRKPIWLRRPLGIEPARKEAASIELETQIFYEKAAAQTTDVAIRKLLLDLAEEERGHVHMAEKIEHETLTPTVEAEEEEAKRRLFVLQIVQPGLAGFMDGSVSTLAPLFAAAFATHNSHETLLVGVAASVGAGISMGFTEALSDDGVLTGRGHPFLRGVVCGLMTTVGGIGHALPYLIPSFEFATAVAFMVVLVELAIIVWIRHKYMDTPWFSATFQVGLGGVLVFLAGILIGSA